MRLHRPPAGSAARLAAGALSCAVLAGCGPADAERTATPGTGTVSSAGAATGAEEPEEPAARTEIPEDFPLSAGMGGPGDTIPTSRTGTGLRGLELCDRQPLRDLGVRDRMVADNSGGEAANTRELVLLGSAEEADRVALDLADLAEHCGTPQVNRRTETLTDVRDSPFGDVPAVTLVQTYSFDGAPGTGATVLHVVPVGAALLVTSTYAQWPLEELEQAIVSTVRPLRPTVRALTALADPEPTQPPTEPPTASPSGTATARASASRTPEQPTTIPARFPLAADLADGDADTAVSSPDPDGEGVGPVETGGQQVWPPRGSGTPRLAAGARGPETSDVRELVVHRDAADAVRVHQFTRVGEAILLVSTYGEGSLASLGRRADEVTETTGTIVPAMCVFTKTGC